MHYFTRDFSEIDHSDLINLVDQKISESKNIEYKRKVISARDADKKEFLADVSSFANSSGGVIIYGIIEKAGIPVEICGFSCKDIDEEILRLESIILSGIQPRILGLKIKSIRIADGKYVLLMEIPISYSSPHMVTYQNSSKFFARNSAGKYQLDVNELRSKFLLSDSVRERIVGFRLDRIAKINSNETPVNLEKGPKIVVHFLPLASFTSNLNLDLTYISDQKNILNPIYGRLNDFRYNFDGYLTFIIENSGISSAYLQIFKTGCLESVDTALLNDKGNDKLIPSRTFEEILSDSIYRFSVIEKELGLNFPFIVMISLLNIKGYQMGVRNTFSRPQSKIDRTNLLLNPIEINNEVRDPFEILRPAFDSIWNACGWPRSIYFDMDGNRKDV